MIEIPTLLILGAGASEPYDYPLGLELRDRINEDLIAFIKNDYDHHWAEDLEISRNLITKFTQYFDSSMSYSIDSFLEHQDEDFVEIGKLAIVNQITKSESAEKLFHEAKRDDDWYRYLINKLTNNTPFDSIKDNKLEIITFNYDRSLEMALITALAAFYATDYKESSFLIKNFPILHMYGQLDPLLVEIPLPGQEKEGRTYGAPCSSEKLKIISENIKLIHEAKEDKTIEKANKMIEKAKRIYFLGLDLRNKENLGMFDLSLFKGKNTLATAYGLKMGEINQIKKLFSDYEISSTVSTMKSLESIRTHQPFE